MFGVNCPLPMKKNNTFTIILPLVICTSLAVGIYIGAYFWGTSLRGDELSRLKEVLGYIQEDYVDTVNTKALINNGIEGMLTKLDPHSVYIPKEDVAIANAQLEGGFHGIGVEFQIIQDTICVVTAISGGPSESLGIRSGDKIVKVDGIQVTGIGITINDVFKKLRGEKGTKVKVSIWRKGMKKILDFVISRDQITTHSVDVYYMIDAQTGYMKVSKFGEKTYDEFKEALTSLKSTGMKRLLLDLRDNPGGYLDKAIKITDEFLGAKKLIVYTDGKGSKYDSKSFAESGGEFETGAVIVMVNEGSASASEIVSGALQDNDRALIVGRRTFGKGLVQRPIELSDGSELRLTISKYYTPSGRCIQKPFSEDYEDDILKRYKNGEFYHADSIKMNDSLKFKTTKGRTVYGGGGIMPDVFVPRDTTMHSAFLGELYSKNIIREVALNFITENKVQISKIGMQDFIAHYQVPANLFQEVLRLATREKIKYTPADLKRSTTLINIDLKAYIGRGAWGDKAFYPIFHQQDELFKKALQLFGEAALLK